jgi:tetratricopeptide (TPR) repeat protein
MLRLLVILLSLLVASPAHLEAAPRKGALTEKQKEQRGRVLFARGKELADAGRYVEALVELTKGYELTGRPLFLFNMAEVARAMGDTAQAKEMYEKYLAAEANGPFANAARARLVELAPPPPPPAEPPPTTSPTQTPATIPSPRDAAVTVDQRRSADVSAQSVRPRSESHTVRNVLIVGITVAVLAGAVAIYAGTHETECAPGCIDLR